MCKRTMYAINFANLRTWQGIAVVIFAMVLPFTKAPAVVPATPPSATTPVAETEETPVMYRVGCGPLTTCDLRKEYCDVTVPTYKRCRSCAGICKPTNKVFGDCQSQCNHYLVYLREADMAQKMREDIAIIVRTELSNSQIYVGIQQTKFQQRVMFGVLLAIILASLAILVIGLYLFKRYLPPILRPILPPTSAPTNRIQKQLPCSSTPAHHRPARSTPINNPNNSKHGSRL